MNAAGLESNDGSSATDNRSTWQQQAQMAAEAVENAVRANAALESCARRIDGRIAPLVEVQQQLATVAAELRELAMAREKSVAGENQSVQREFERLRKEQAEKFKATEERIGALGDTLAILSGQLKTLSVRSNSVPDQTASPARTQNKAATLVNVEETPAVKMAEPVLASSGVSLLETTGIGVTAEESSVLSPPEKPDSSRAEVPTYGAISLTAIEVGPPATTNQPTEEKTMLAKALARAQSSGQTPAVAGIIMARARRSRKSKAPIPVVEASSAIVADTVTPAVETERTTAAQAEAEGWSALSEIKIDQVSADEVPALENTQDQTEADPITGKVEDLASAETSSAERRSARAKAVALRGDEEEAARKDTPVVFTPNRVDDSSIQSLEGPTQGELLAREAETIRKKRSSRSPVSACALTARVLIGIGNKPFVRGTGPGLSNDKGVPMEFVEIGQWRWVAPTAVKEAISIRILKNDEVPAAGEPITLHPGQSLEINPVFPA